MTEPDPDSVELIKKKAKEKGINPVYPPGMKLRSEQSGNLLDHKLNRLESGQTSIDNKLNKIIRFITAVDSKISTLMDEIKLIKDSKGK